MPPMESKNTAFEIVKTTLGAVSIKDTRYGEIMHNPVGPWREAQDLYVTQSGLRQRLLDETTKKEVVLFDVGLGAGFNAMAAVSEYFRCRERGCPRKLTIISFESDLSLFGFAKDHIDQFKGYDGFHILMHDMLKNREMSSDNGLTWIIREGAFAKTIAEETMSPDIIFHDPYSPKVNPEMWTEETFKKLYELASVKTEPCVLVTYSMATSVRAALLLAGFYVGVGASSGAKAETTFASTALSKIKEPLGQRWLERWGRSHSPLPAGQHPEGEEPQPVSDEVRDTFKERLLRHPQFKQA